MIKKVTTCGVLTSLAIVISTLERFIPLESVIPIPGIKLGFSNIIILLILLKLGFRYALPSVICKCAVVSFLFSGISSFIYSLFGGILSILGMFILLKFDRCFSVCGVSIAGAALHNVGQILAASIMLQSSYVFAYLAMLLFVSIITGTVTGLITDVLNTRIKVVL